MALKPFFISLIYRLLIKSYRINIDSTSTNNCFVLGVWHQDLPIALAYFKHRQMGILLSMSDDANHFESALLKLNYKLFRGSSSRNFKTTRHLIKHLKNGKPVGMALDGPKGPKKVEKPGTQWLAHKSQKPFIELSVEYHNYWELNTWDNMKIPKPFSKVTLTLTERPIHS